MDFFLTMSYNDAEHRPVRPDPSPPSPIGTSTTPSDKAHIAHSHQAPAVPIATLMASRHRAAPLLQGTAPAVAASAVPSATARRVPTRSTASSGGNGCYPRIVEVLALLLLSTATVWIMMRAMHIRHASSMARAHERAHVTPEGGDANLARAAHKTTTRNPVAQRVADAFVKERAAAPVPKSGGGVGGRKRRKGDTDDEVDENDGDADFEGGEGRNDAAAGASPMDDEAERERDEKATKARAAMAAAIARGEHMPDVRSEEIRPSGRGALRIKDLFVHQGNFQKLLGHYADENGTLTINNLRSLPSSDMRILDSYNFSSCAVVGNSGHLLNATYGAAIDSHDVVLRLNQAPPGDRVNKLIKNVGSRTTFRLINTRWANKYGDLRYVDGGGLPLEDDVTLIVTRARPKAYDQMAQYLKTARSDVTALYLSSRVVGKARQLLLEYRQRLEERGFGPFYGGSTPSSGFVGVYLLLQMCGTVTVYGFGLDDENSGERHTYHYFYLFSPQHSRKKNSMNRTHSFDAERALLRALVEAGLVTFCSPKIGGTAAENKLCGLRPKALRARPSASKDDLFLEGFDIKPVVKKDAAGRRRRGDDFVRPFARRRRQQ